MSRPFCHRRLQPRQQRVQPGVCEIAVLGNLGQVGRVTPCAPARRSRRRWLAIAAGRGLPALPTNGPRLSLIRKPKLALANSSGTGSLPVELRLRPHGGFFPAPRGKRPARCRSHYRRQFPFRSSGSTGNEGVANTRLRRDVAATRWPASARTPKLNCHKRTQRTQKGELDPILGREGALRRPRCRAQRQATEPDCQSARLGSRSALRFAPGGDSAAARCPYSSSC
jgi:hypothetical protein